MNRLIVSAVAIAAWTCAASGETYDETTGFVTLLQSDDGSAYSLDNAVNNWSDKAAPHADTNYYVAAGLTARSTTSAFSFPGKLVSAGTLLLRGDSNVTTTFADLQLMDGGQITCSGSRKLAGRIEVLANDSEKPAVVRATPGSTTNTGVEWKATTVGAEDAVLHVGVAGDAAFILFVPYGSGKYAWKDYRGTVSFADGWSWKDDYGSVVCPGSLRFGANSRYYQFWDSPYSLGNLSFVSDAVITNYSALNVSGQFSTGKRARWFSCPKNADSISTIGTLSIGEGTSYFAQNYGKTANIVRLDVTNRLEIGADVTLRCSDFSTETTSAKTLIRLSPEAVLAGLPDVSGVTAIGPSRGSEWRAFPVPCMAYADDPDVSGGKLLQITSRPVVNNVDANPGTDSRALDRDADASLYWSDGEFPGTGRDYMLGKGKCVSVRAPTAEYPNRVTTFPGETLTLSDTATIYFFTSFTVADLHLRYRGILYAYETASLNGKLTLEANEVSDYLHQAKLLSDTTLTINAEICGVGDLLVWSYYPSQKGGTLVLNGINTNWYGAINTSYTKAKKSPDPSETAHARIVVGDGRALGGTLSAFKHDSLTLNGYAELSVTNSTVFAEATRGIKVNKNGCLSATAGVRAKFTAPVSLLGTLRKAGAGLVELAGGVRFAMNDDLNDAGTPIAESNIVRVAEGDLKIGAANGVAFSLATGTRLVVDAATGPVTETTLDAPFACDDGKLVIVPDAETVACPENAALELPVVRVKSGAAESVAAMLCVKSPWKGIRADITAETQDGVTTFKARFCRHGLMLLVR